MRASHSPMWHVILRWCIGVLLVWAALGKLANLQEFLATLAAYRLPLSMTFLRGTAMVLPWMELLCGLLLIAGSRIHAALMWSLVMFVVFSICTGQAWLRGLKIACGCLDLRLMGILPETPTAMFLESVEFAFLRALVLAGAAGLLLRSHHGSARSPDA